MDLASEFGVGLQLQLLGFEVMVGPGLLESRLTVLADHHEGRQEDVSSDTTRVNVGQGLRSRTIIHKANNAA